MPLSLPNAAACLRPAALVTMMFVAGCAGDEKFPPDCRANVALAPGAADLSLYRPGGRDLTDLELEARISAVSAACLVKDPNTVSTKIRVDFTLARGPAAAGRNAQLRYFVAVTDGGRVLDEQDYALRVSFPPNIETVVVKGDEITLLLPVSPQKSAGAYTIYTSFRLTPEQLAVNRARGAR